MSSVIRSLAEVKEALTKFVKPETPAYYDDDADIDVLFPFSYSNQVLDITYAGNTFKTRMIDTTNRSPGSEPDTIIRILSGPYLVKSLGPNFKAYIRAWRANTIDAGSPIEIYVAPQVLRVQEADYENITSSSGDSWEISTSAPASENYIIGDATNNYRTTYVFKSPLTFTLVESGIIKYITFKTALDQE
jgi:hypothetical protein